MSRHRRGVCALRVTALLALLAPFPATTASSASAHLSVIRQGRDSADSAESQDLFGFTLCTGDFNGDGFDDLATAAVGEDVVGFPGGSHGVVTVNWGTALGLTHVGAQLVLPPFQESGFVFGWAMASADFNADGFDDLVIGMPYADRNGMAEVGAVAVFRGTALGLESLAIVYDAAMLGGSPQPGALFGNALAAGDFDGDGDPDLVVGSPGVDNNAGEVFFVFCGPLGLTTVGSYSAKQSSFGGTDEQGDEFGSAIAIGNFTGLNPPPPLVNPQDVAVSAPNKRFNGVGAVGMVAVFASTNSGPKLNLVSRYTPSSLGVPNPSMSGGRFGASLAKADFYQDGYDDLAVGRPARWPDSGEVVLARGSGFGLVYAKRHTPGDFGLSSTQDDRFGWSLAAGDYDGDGFADLLVGSPRHGLGLMNTGRAYLYRSLPTVGLAALEDFTQFDVNVDPVEYYWLGETVAFGLFDDSGRANVVLGAPGADVETGEVHIVAPWRQPAPLQCRRSVVLDCADRIVYSQRPFEPVHVAQTAMIMTALLALERTQLPPGDPDFVHPDATYTVPAWVANDVTGTQYGLVENEIVTLRTLIDMTLSVGGSDAAYAIADQLTGGNATFNGLYDVVPTFLNEMNARASQLGMLDTTFTTPAGYSGASYASTAYDMALLGRAAMQNAAFEAVVNNPGWTIWRTVPVQGGGYFSFMEEIGGGFVAGLQSWLPEATGLRDGWTMQAGLTGVFSARESDSSWGTVVGSSFLTTESAGSISADAAKLLTAGLQRCSNGAFISQPSYVPSWQERPNLSPALLQEHGFLFYPPDPIHKQALLEIYNQVQDGVPAEIGVEVVRVTTTSIPDQLTASYVTDDVSGHDGITLVNEGIGAASVRVTSNALGNPVYDFFLQPGASAQVPPQQLSGGAASFKMDIQALAGPTAVLRVMESYSESYSLGNGVQGPSKVSMVFHRDDLALVQPRMLNVKLIGMDGDAGHLVGLVLRGPDGAYSFDPCRARAHAFGAGWSGLHGVPTLTTDGPPVQGSSMSMQFGNSLLAGAAGLWAIGFQPLALPTNLGGTLNVQPFALLPLNLPATGLDLTLQVPADPFLCGLSFYHQLFVADPFASHGFSFSRGLRAQFGH